MLREAAKKGKRGLKALVDCPLKNERFFAASHRASHNIDDDICI